MPESDRGTSLDFNINFADQIVKDRLAKKKIKAIPKDPRVELGTGVGMVVLDDVLAGISISQESDYGGVLRQIMNDMMRMADERSIVHKEESKERLKERNKFWYRLIETFGRK